MPPLAEPECDGECDCDGDDADAEHAQGPEWKRLYGKCSANEIYHIRLSDSRFFGEYQGKSFTYASFHSHRKFGVALIGVQTDMRGTWPIMLNPGPSYVLKSSDILFYINITKEENSTLMPMLQHHHAAAKRSRQMSQSPAPQPPPLVSDVDKVATASEATVAASVAAAVADDEQTSIRIEASSPQQPSGTQTLPRVELTTLKKHSVADGASMVVRSLCSVAGFGQSELRLPNAESGGGDEEDDDAQESSKAMLDNTELQGLAATLLSGKRNSSASTMTAQVAHVQQQQQSRKHKRSSGGLQSSSRNASTLELATLASGLRKGSNLSITSTRSRDASPTRLKQVVSGLAVKMKRVKLGKSLTHLTIPRMDYGGSSTSSTESFVNARGRRPSIAPVPAMMGESEEHDSDHEREQESYFAMSWQSSNEQSPIVKKFVFCTTYVGVSPTLCYLLQKKKSPCCLQLISSCEHCAYKNARQYNWPNRCIILASDFASNGIYNFLVPLRAHFHNPNELRPIVLLLERKPSPQFIDAISWFPMVYWMPGSIDCLDDLIKAGINQAHSVVVTNKESTNSAEEDYLADCNTIVAVQTMFKMFPSAGIITELSQSSNMRFMQFRAHDLLLGGLSMANYCNQSSLQVAAPLCDLWTNRSGRHSSGGDAGAVAAACAAAAAAAAQSDSGTPPAAAAATATTSGQSVSSSSALRDRIHLRKLHSHLYSKSSMGKEVNSHAYKYRLPFAAGNVFSASMLDTLLYQAFVKDYMITMVRLLLGIDQAPGSGFLSSMKITKEDLWIRTYGRLYQRLCSTTCEIPLGIYRTEPLESQRHAHDGLLSFGAFASQQASYEHATEELERIEISNMVKNRLQDLGMLVSDYDDSPASRNTTFSYVIINPNCDIQLREGDIIYLIRPSPIHSRKLFMHRANSVRRADDPSQMRSGTAAAAAAATATATPSPAAAAAALITSAARKQAEQPRAASRQSADLAAHLKSCLSDGDFNEILIKVNEHSDADAMHASCGQQLDTSNINLLASRDAESPASCGAHQVQRRRSSCSDVEI